MEVELPVLKTTTDRRKKQAETDDLDNQKVKENPAKEEKETMLEEEQPIRIPLLAESIDDAPSQISDKDNFRCDDGSASSSHQDQLKPSLPWPLLLSYSIYGFSMSLPSLPVMYILNTRVPLPLSILPTYGALAFLPFSFKPLYAYLSSHYLTSRRHGLSIGWALCAMTTIGWTFVPSVPFVFAVGIANGTAMAWSGFLLGLTLLDTARAHCHLGDGAFEASASVFQSQAATARNVGSLSASIVTCLVFGFNRNSTAQSEWSASLVDGLFWATACCHLLSLLLVLACRPAFEPFMFPAQRSTTATTTHNTAANSMAAETTTIRPSYAALEVHQGDDDSETTPLGDDDDDQDESSSSSICSVNVIVIVTLQVSILILAMRKQLVDILARHHHAIPVALGLLSVILILAAIPCLGRRRRQRGNHTTTRSVIQQVRRLGWPHVMGLVLVLRHAVPEPSAILSSFLYHCFQTQPVWLQVFSLADTGMITVASWSYQKLWAPHYSHGRKLITLMAIMTVAKHLMQNIYLLVVNSSDNTAKAMFPWMVLAIKALSAFVMEWSFLPSIVLATVSVSETKATWHSTNEEKEEEGVIDEYSTTSSNCGVGEDDDEETQQTAGEEESTGERSSGSNQPIVVKTSASTNVMYGSLVSCIDFGDQVGAMLSTPLITAFGITRENNWQSLDRLIEVCSGIGVLSAGLFLLLLYYLPPGDRKKHPSHRVV